MKSCHNGLGIWNDGRGMNAKGFLREHKRKLFAEVHLFYNKLKSNGYFRLFKDVRNMAEIEGKSLDWTGREEWKIRESAWEVLEKRGIDPMLVFMHPKILQLNPSFLKYYRSVAMLSQKGLKVLAGVSGVEKIESGKVESGKLPKKSIINLVSVLNELLSLVISLATDIGENEIQGMMYATAGTNIDGSWRNSIGVEGERVIRGIVLKELLAHNEVSSITDRQNKTTALSDLQADGLIDSMDKIKAVNLTNGCSMLFSSEPDIAMFDGEGAVIGIVEIKAGLDPAGALERLGAIFKTFENTLAEYPNAVTILVASCITEEVEARIGASMLVRQKYITAEIMSSDNHQRKFANGIRRVLKLI